MYKLLQFRWLPSSSTSSPTRPLTSLTDTVALFFEDFRNCFGFNFLATASFFWAKNPGYWTHGNHSNVVPWKSYDLWADFYPWKYDQNGDYIDPSKSNFCVANLFGNLSRYPRNSRRYYPFMGYLGLPSKNCIRRLEHKQWHVQT